MKRSSFKPFLLILVVLMISCQSKPKQKIEKPILRSGIWRMEMALNKSVLPFNFELSKDSMVIVNGEERIVLTDIKYQGDSITISHPVFESEFFLKAESDSSIEGVWVNYYKGADYKIKVKAKYGDAFRFTNQNKTSSKAIDGKYEVTFSPQEDPSKAIGVFKQNGKELNATFATETGDYRYLQGEIIKDSIFLSTFDGSHAFLFEAELVGDSIKGVFWSGTHWEESWIGFKNELATLTHPDSLTFLKNDKSIEFSFVSSEGEEYSYPNQEVENHVVVLQIMGSWCPNCLDETYFLSKLNKEYEEDSLTILALAFERTRSEEQAMKNLKSIRSKTKANYPFLLAGYDKTTQATDVFPMLNHVMSYPTTIFIDKKGQVRKIHTGFYGPSTGEYYNNFVTETKAFIQLLLEEV